MAGPDDDRPAERPLAAGGLGPPPGPRAPRGVRPTRSRWSSRSLRALLLATLLVGALGTFGLAYLLLFYADAPGPGKGEVVAIELSSDDTPESVAQALSVAGALRTPRRFALYVHALGAAGDLRRGEVLVRDDMGPRTLLRRVAAGHGGSELRVTIPEGHDRFDVAALLDRWGVCDAGAFLTVTAERGLLSEYGIEAGTAEGYLFPDTYRLRDDRDAEAAARRLLDNGRRRLRALLADNVEPLAALRTELGWSLHEVVTLASIVELEAAIPAERPRIAGVFFNRLRDPDFRPRRLQADPTVAYGCRLRPQLPPCQAFDGRHVTRRMTADRQNRYNTYRHDGLPPGPIGNPGLGALHAVLHPERHGDYYFVARGDGSHAFSATLEAHNAAVKRHLR